VPSVSVSAARDTEGRLQLALVNLDPNREAVVTTSLAGAKASGAQGRVLTSKTMDARNTVEAPESITPVKISATRKGRCAGAATAAYVGERGPAAVVADVRSLVAVLAIARAAATRLAPVSRKPAAKRQPSESDVPAATMRPSRPAASGPRKRPPSRDSSTPAAMNPAR
jgi:hypothetical protein